MVGVPQNNELLDAALSYIRRGWRVLPLHSITDSSFCTCGRLDCSSPGKHPRILSGSLGASIDQGQVETWWNLWPTANVGIATGRESGLVVLDADGDEGLSSLTGLTPTTEAPNFSVFTGSGGKHIYYSYPDDGTVVRNSAKKLAPGVDVRGDGGYVVAPPSVHASGKRYRLAGPDLGGQDHLVVYPFASAQEASYEPTDVPGLIPQGQRNSTLLSLAGSFRRKGLGEEEIFVALQGVNKHRCSPELGDNELRNIAHSVLRYRPEDPIPVRGTQHTQIRVYSAKDLCAIQLPDQDQLVGPILVRGNRLVIAGHTGEGKTTFALQLIDAAINGTRFLKWMDRPDRPLQALVLDAEQGLRTIQRRLHEVRLAEATNLDYIRVPDGLDLDDASQADIIEEVIDTKRYDVVVLDPLYKLHKGEVTDERVAVELMRRLDAWRERYHFALVLLAHCRKPLPGAPFTIHDVFGSTAVSRGAEVILGLQRTEPGAARVHFFKDRDGDLPIGETWDLAFSKERGYEVPSQLLWQDETGDNAIQEDTVTDRGIGGIVIDMFRTRNHPTTET